MLVVGVVAAILIEEGEPFLRWTLPVLAGPVAAAALFACGSLGGLGTRYWAYRVTGWAGMLAGSFILISFSFLIWPVLLLEIPLLWKWAAPVEDGAVDVRR